MDNIQTILENKELLKQIILSADPKEAYDILSHNGFESTYEDFLKFMEAILVAYEKRQAGLLSEEDMDDLFDIAQSTDIVGTPWILFFIICKN